jgi:hypothetical protein
MGVGRSTIGFESARSAAGGSIGITIGLACVVDRSGRIGSTGAGGAGTTAGSGGCDGLFDTAGCSGIVICAADGGGFFVGPIDSIGNTPGGGSWRGGAITGSSLAITT